MSEQRGDGGVLFKEKTKKTDRAPDYRGRLTVGGIEYDLAGWRKTDKNGDAFLSLSVRPPRERRDGQRAEVRDDDTPF